MTIQKAIFAGGCFWCTEAVFVNLKGVQHVVSGYIGGTVENPTYEQVCNGNTGHVEAIQIEFDSEQITYTDLLYVFFYTHNPTTVNQQGNDIGTQYNSAIFYFDQKQKEDIEKVIQQLEEEKVFDKKIITDVRKAETFYSAEKYHQNYYEENSDKPYCQIVIFPKIEKLKNKFKHLLKDDRVL